VPDAGSGLRRVSSASSTPEATGGPRPVSAPETAGRAGAVPRARVDQLLSDGTLSRYPCCPFCGGSRRRPVADSAGDNRYTRAIPLVAPMTVGEVRDLLQVFCCDECSACYCDPWLSRRTSGRLYATGFGQHVQGWRVFHESVADSEVETHDHWQRHTWERINAVAGRVGSYAELNCPFTGLLTLFRRAEVEPTRYRRLARAALRSLRAGRRYSGGLGQSLERLLPRTRPRDPGVPVENERLGTPGERCLVIEPSSLCWGSNCVASGVSCQAVASALLAAEVVNFEDIRRDGTRFDVAVLTQLDHHFEPMTLLDRFLEIATFVVVAGHSSSRFTKQHLMAFGPRTVQHLASRGYAAADWTQQTVHPSKRSVNQCFLVSKQVRF